MLKDGLAAQLQGYDLSSQGGTRRRNTLKLRAIVLILVYGLRHTKKTRLLDGFSVREDLNP